MQTIDILTISKEAIYLFLKISLPILLITLIVGLIISLLQALTQLQEATLTFVPKLIVISLLLLLMMPYISANFHAFMNLIINNITVSY